MCKVRCWRWLFGNAIPMSSGDRIKDIGDVVEVKVDIIEDMGDVDEDRGNVIKDREGGCWR